MGRVKTSGQCANTAADTANKLIQAKAIQAQIENTIADTAEKTERTKNYSFERDYTSARTENVKSDTRYKDLLPSLLDAQIASAVAQAGAFNASSAHSYADIGRIGAEKSNIDSRTRGQNWENTFKEFDAPRQRNLSNFQQGFYAKYIEPAVNSVFRGNRP